MTVGWSQWETEVDHDHVEWETEDHDRVEWEIEQDQTSFTI